MSMTRRDYKMVATLLQEEGNDQLTQKFADAFDEHSSFNREKFLAAAGMKE